MTPKQLRSTLARLNVSPLTLAKLFDKHPRTIHRWLKGKPPMPRYALIILRLMLAGKITILDVEDVVML